MKRGRQGDISKINGLQVGIVDEKLKPQLYSALDKDIQKCLGPRTQEKILGIKFAEVCHLLETIVATGTNLTNERFKYFVLKTCSSKIVDETLTELAKNFCLGYLKAD